MRLFHLPDDILLTLVSNWLFAGDVCRLDSCLCSQNYRDYFLQFISRSNVSLKPVSCFFKNVERNNLRYWDWFQLRNISLIKLFDYHLFDISKSLQSPWITNIVKKVNSIYVDCGWLVLNSLLNSKNILDKLVFSESCVNDNICECFLPTREFNNLKILMIFSARNVTDAFLIMVSKSCIHLHALTLYGCDLITDVGLISVLNSNPKLEFVDCYSCPLVTHSAVNYAGSNCPKLKVLKCDVKGDVELFDFVLNCPQISHLCLPDASVQSISHNRLRRLQAAKHELNLTNLSVFGLAYGDSVQLAMVLNRCKLYHLSIHTSVLCIACVCSIASSSQHLEYCFLNKCQLIGPSEVLKDGLMMSNKITHLQLTNATFVNDALIVPIIKSIGHQLSHLKLDGTSITDITLDAFAEHRPVAFWLYIFNCPAITSDGIRSLLAGFKCVPHCTDCALIVPIGAFRDQDEINVLEAECDKEAHIQFFDAK